jgi:hypothetical protein
VTVTADADRRRGSGVRQDTSPRRGADSASGFDVKSGFGAIPAADQAVPLGALIDALFEGSPPILERDALRGLHIVPAERYWLL